VVLASSGAADHLEHARRLLDVDDLVDAATSAYEQLRAAGAVVVLDDPADVIEHIQHTPLT
jgi:hypothetical protein